VAEKPEPKVPPTVFLGGGAPASLFREGGKPDIEAAQEKTRRQLALILAWLLFITALSLIGLVAVNAIDIEDAKDLAASVLSPVVAVTGTALGFYFGGHRGKSDN
jgi:hypothetical protein